MLRRSLLFFVIAIIAAVAGFDALRSTDSPEKHDYTKQQAKAEIDRRLGKHQDEATLVPFAPRERSAEHEAGQGRPEDSPREDGVFGFAN